ncbi:HlyD family efflux transporter periplasmic adaptor subunit [Paraflavitalea sp. CAU 1676]|uniref:HlyD family secretion protein n=1 Tax=Paraflavitalea sp. CAU 1676 TaxID=3032598 RepID=UPI0023DC9F8E|nr:HlyD family efflux transporter periplasmic adaptor subunit [Paraflavitalea sp. CAU 1676]MDF2190087.1 HlyD family efflux transporter periplasmic adaptor subunit [Paraflavitalea sp. CAU 1676]
MKKLMTGMLVAAIALLACNRNKVTYDASGSFEVDEVIVSAELTGKLLSFDVMEGDSISKGKVIGTIDAENLSLQKDQVQASIEALREKTADLTPQIKLLQDQLIVQQSQLDRLQREKQRTENLLKQDAATGKQLDDLNAEIDVVKKQMDVTRQQINVQRSNIGTQNRSILSEGKPMEKRVAQLDDQLKRAGITNPVNGTVITKYAEAGEMTSTGKALYKIADLSTMTLRAYITGTQLSQVKLNQPVKVLIDNGAEAYREYSGTITWISDKAEFTPKTIQTKEERANLVYAIKVKVKNDGFIKIGMYGEVKF